MEVFKKIWAYLTFKKSTREGNSYLKMMHGINKISIFMALIAFTVLIIKCAK